MLRVGEIYRVVVYRCISSTSWCWEWGSGAPGNVRHVPALDLESGHETGEERGGLATTAGCADFSGPRESLQEVSVPFVGSTAHYSQSWWSILMTDR